MSTTTFRPSELLRAQDAFLTGLTRLHQALKTRHPGWLIKAMEVGVQKGRKSVYGTKYQDAVHMATSLHYEGLAADLFVAVPAEDVDAYREANEREWQEVHELWTAIGEAEGLGANPNNAQIRNDSCHVSRDPKLGDPRA